MGQKATINDRDPVERGADLSIRQVRVLEKIRGRPAKRSLTAQIKKIALELNKGEKTVWRDLKAIRQSDWVKRQTARIEATEDYLFANWLANVMSGNYEPVKDVWKTLGVLKERIEIVAKVEPGEQQKKFMGNMETLLKLSGDKVRGALPETKETETQSQGKICTCAADVYTEGMTLVGRDPKCPVHGDKDKEQGGGHPPPGGSEV